MASTSKTKKATSADNDGADVKESSNSLSKMLSILDLFVPERPVWSTNDIINSLGTSRSTGYRYIKALNNTGLLSAVGNGAYVLGPRIIELDLQIRSSDPLLQAGKGVLEQLVDVTGHSALMCMLYRNSVICIREQLAPLSPEHLFSRGQRRSLFRGAMSKVILAQLPHHRLRSIYSRHEAEIKDANLGADWGEFRETLGQIRKDGHAMSCGEFNAGVVGIAAPLYDSANLILGSIGIVISEAELRDVDLNRITIAVKRAAREITSRMATMIPQSEPAAGK